MSQVSYGTITITDTTDLTTYIRYAKKSPLTVASDFQETPTTDTHFIAVLSIPSSNTIPAWNSTDWKWSEFIGTDGLSVKNTRILYYLKTNSADVPQVDKNTSIVSTDTQNAWTSKNPTYVANGTYWTCLEVTLSDNTTKSWSVPAEDLGLTQAAKDAAETKSIATHANEDAQGAMSQASAANIIAEGLQTRLKYMWMNEVNSTSYPAGSYMASGNNRTFSYSDSSTYGFNSFLAHTKLHFRYNAIDLTTIGLDGLKLYSPILNSGNTEIVNSKMGINITSEQIHIGGNGEDEEGYIIVDTDGMKIYSKYTPIIHGGTSVYGFDMVAQIGANTRIGALESGHMLLQPSGLWLKEKNNIIGSILNSSVHDLIPNYTEIFKFQWDINTTLQTSFESTFGVNYGTLSFLCGIQSEDDIIWGSSSSVTIDGTTYSFMLEESFTDSFIPSTCTITSFQQNTTRSVTVVVQLTYTAATSGPYTSFGQNANVQGTGGFAAGIGVSSLGLGQVVLGQYNQEDFHAKFIIGNGTDDNNRSNLLVVDGDGNLLIQDGFKIVNTTGNCIQLTSDGMEIFKAAISVAKFGSEIRIGKIDESHIFQDFNSWHMVDKEGQTYVNIEDMRDSYGYADIVDTFIGRGDQSKYTTSLVISRGTPGHKISDPILTINNVQQDYTDDIDIYTRSYMTIIRLFTHTTDTEIDSDKDYYIRTKLQSIFNAFEMVNTPIASDLSTYYELCPLADGDILVASYKTDSSQAKAFTFGTRKSQSNIGAYSFINGFDCTASGNNSSAEGNETTASGISSHAEGYNTTASGSNSHAEGYNTTASGSNSHAEGYHTTASEYNSHAEGVGATASGYNSHAEGYSTTASGYESHAEGRETIASNSRSHAEGYRTTASNTNSHAEGDETTASGSNSHAEGYNTTASGISSHAEGDRTTASGDISHAEGSLTIAEGDGSHAEGIYTRAFGDYSHAQNCGTTASQDSQTAIGKYNSNNSNTAFEIGNGTDDTHRSNAFVVTWTGNIVSSGNITDGSGNILSNKVNISELNSINTRVTTVESGIFALDVDASASASTDATSGEDMDLFNNIRTLGWYSDIIV